MKQEKYTPVSKAIPALGLAWAGFLLATAIAALCPRFTAYYAIYLAVTLGLAAGCLAFLDAIYRRGKHALHPAFKKFLGYGLVLHYAAAALPRVDWEGSGLIGQGRVIFLFVLALLCLATGVVLFVVSGRPSTYAALGLISKEEVGDKALRKKRTAQRRKRGFLRGTLEWVDALGFAAILVILLQTFVFQLYVVPTPSMVPAFMVKDRPFTSKLDAGPRIPLTGWRLPFLRLPKRGDIVTIANPRYPENQGVNLKKSLAQFVSMITFTAVNIDKYLPDGSEKADPLVKRIVGLPGEKLMMVDDVLYAKRSGEAAFSPVEADKAWARPDLWKESAAIRDKLESLPIDESRRVILDTWDARKRDADPAALAIAIALSYSGLASLSDAAKAEAFLKQLAKEEPKAFSVVAADKAAYERPDPSAGNPIAAAGARADDLAIALSLLSSAKLRPALADYAATKAATLPAANAYRRGGRALDLLVKDNVLKRTARVARLIVAGGGLAALRGDATYSALGKEGGELVYYLDGLYDARNFPEFPAGDEFLGPKQYFAMGDNRYASLDFRYLSGDYSAKPLDPENPCSVLYMSNVDPFALDLRFIEGYALFRAWPPSRFGAIR
jgi:signal peptidase I